MEEYCQYVIWKNQYHALLIDIENAFFQAKQIFTNSSPKLGLQLLDMDICTGQCAADATRL